MGEVPILVGTGNWRVASVVCVAVHRGTAMTGTGPDHHYRRPHHHPHSPLGSTCPQGKAWAVGRDVGCTIVPQGSHVRRQHSVG